MSTNATPPMIKSSEVVSLHRPSGELTFTAADENVKPGDVVQYQGVAFTVSEKSRPDDKAQVTARAYPASAENLGDVEPWVLRLKPGDVVVLTSKITLDAATVADLAERLKAIVPGYEVMILDSSVKIGRIRPDVGSDD